MATDIAFDNVKQLLPKCCHAIAGKYIASNDKLCGNVESDIAGDFVATPHPLGKKTENFQKAFEMKTKKDDFWEDISDF